MTQKTPAPGGIGAKLVGEMTGKNASFEEVVSALKTLLNVKLISQLDFSQLVMSLHKPVVEETIVRSTAPIETVEETVETVEQSAVTEPSVTQYVQLLEELSRNITDECFAAEPRLGFIDSEEQTLDQLAEVVFTLLEQQQRHLAGAVNSLPKDSKSKVRTAMGFHLMGLMPEDESVPSILTQLQVSPSVADSAKLEIFSSFVELLFGVSSVELARAIHSLWAKLGKNFSFARPLPTMAFMRRLKEQAEDAGCTGEDFEILASQLASFDPVTRGATELAAKAALQTRAIDGMLVWRGDDEEILRSLCGDLDFRVAHAGASMIPSPDQLEQMLLKADQVLDTEDEIAQRESLLGWKTGTRLADSMRGQDTSALRSALQVLAKAGIIGREAVTVLCPDVSNAEGLALVYGATRIQRKIDAALEYAGTKHQRIKDEDGQYNIILPDVPRPVWHKRKFGPEGYWNSAMLNDDYDKAARYENRAGAVFARSAVKNGKGGVR